MEIAKIKWTRRRPRNRAKVLIKTPDRGVVSAVATGGGFVPTGSGWRGIGTIQGWCYYEEFNNKGLTHEK